ncbi:unnamed protein product [Notodromas monacha]|uniref:Secreted protein n=1 Tax=Notodromas monacha TaxID=399045 RepID=A0A7R9GGA7_9CRUS|nr:unnamed protein product [Notodromas monacha]CAG0921513.1 unnamed protein product [Notodromas monacha]
MKLVFCAFFAYAIVVHSSAAMDNVHNNQPKEVSQQSSQSVEAINNAAAAKGPEKQETLKPEAQTQVPFPVSNSQFPNQQQHGNQGDLVNNNPQHQNNEGNPPTDLNNKPKNPNSILDGTQEANHVSGQPNIVPNAGETTSSDEKRKLTAPWPATVAQQQN